ncbi:hypothetical protein D3C86_1335720 [compost metagenome]
MRPVGGRPPTIEQTGLRQGNRPRANRAQTPGAETGAAQKLQHARRGRADQVVAQDQQRIEPALVERFGLHSKTGGRLHQATRLGQQGNAVQRLVTGTVGQLEGGTHGQAQNLETGVHNESDLVHGDMTLNVACLKFRPEDLYSNPNSRHRTSGWSTSRIGGWRWIIKRFPSHRGIEGCH